jgi:S-formylglutathione hydrolase FrmB
VPEALLTRDPELASPLEPEVLEADDAVVAESGPKVLRLAGGTVVLPEPLYSESLQQPSWYQVVLPPGYFSSERRYPVLYLLHGIAGGAGEWLEVGIHEAADRLWGEGKLEPFIIVLPEGGQSYYLNHANDGPRWADYISQDVVKHIDGAFRTLAEPGHRAIGGLSMGGDGALQLALHHPDVFGIVGAHSPTTRLSYDQRPGDIYGDEEYWQRHNPLWLIHHAQTAQDLNIWIDVADGDVWLASAQALHEALEEQKVPHAYSENPGIHDGEYWVANQESYLHFYAEAFAGGGPTGSASDQALKPERNEKNLTDPSLGLE